MTYLHNLKRIKELLNPIITFITILLLLSTSCQQSEDSENTESALIDKINAVQEQIMIQGNVSKEEELAIKSLCSIISNNDGLGNYNPSNRMIIKDVDHAPIFPGCEEKVKKELLNCFNDNISKFIKREFDLSISQNLRLSEPGQVDAFFIINENGALTGMKVRDAEVNIQGEILRVFRKIPLMKPATHNGKNVAVLCSIRLTYDEKIKIETVYIPELPNE